ncbi:glycerate kinase [Paenibacillus cellulosilyticus]|uniref:Glycerate kinase n=1 Tax=Paenibacillus cellulosilyticus TaxID=375489 RepID=A0A2V2YVU5_9BACL|nr:glycerate kinase [Paenibacillus cellulosilyticus]PWW05268.1 glycerate kinase [Paenibacillus cellulosilyticus]QKS43592.1 glycerate kinase [Paenibacillus cellulosilyticus]
MKVVIAIDSFKGSISSIEAGTAAAAGVRDVFEEAEIITVPLADGGEGTVDALIRAASGQRVDLMVTGPLGEPVQAGYGLLDGGATAVIEVAAACGLTLVSPEERDPLATTTFGVGELIADALERGCRRLIVGLGGSATSDAGAGMLQALGCALQDAHGADIARGGGALASLAAIDRSGLHPRLADGSVRIEVACDVDNPLHGPEGAAHVFAPQKGASPAAVLQLDAGLRRFADVCREQLGCDVQRIPGAGAAGGLGAAFAGLLGAAMRPGAALVLEAAGFDRLLPHCDFVITGEGRLDGQTARGKAPLAVAAAAAARGIPVIALAGSIAPEADALASHGITTALPIGPGPMPLEQAMQPETALQGMRRTTRELFRLIRSTKGDHH